LSIWLFPLREVFEVQVVAAANTMLKVEYRAAAVRRWIQVGLRRWFEAFSLTCKGVGWIVIGVEEEKRRARI
jgi:hypothetical protein